MFMKIYKLSALMRYKKGGVLAKQNEPVPDLILIKRGGVNIFKNNHLITTLGPGFFIGEMTFLGGGLSSATVVIDEDETECIIWEKEKLNRFRITNEELYSKLKQDIAINLIKKIEHSSERIVSESDL